MFIFRTILSFVEDEEYRELLITTLITVGTGTIAYHYLEGWKIIDSLYFSVVTLTTIGYGDFSPKTDAGKIFTIGYIIVGIGIILSFINTLQHHYTNMKYSERKRIVNLKKRSNEENELKKKLNFKNIWAAIPPSVPSRYIGTHSGRAAKKKIKYNC